MQALCPHCFGEKKCDKCHEGLVRVGFADGVWCACVCLNSEECGFQNGGCCNPKHEPTKWIPFDDCPELPDPAPYEVNEHKWRVKKLEKQAAEQRERYRRLVAFALPLIPAGRILTVPEAKLLNICRICKKPDPNVYNYGEEFAHRACLEQSGS